MTMVSPEFPRAIRHGESRVHRYNRLMPDPRVAFDLDAYVARAKSGCCFICEFIAGNPAFAHQEVWEDAGSVVFLGKYPTLFGRTIVAPKAHVEGVTGDFTERSYLDLQRVIYWVAEGMREQLDPERIYVLSLGSRQANAHVHWQVAPLPRGLPLEEQQYHALMHEYGVLNLTPEVIADLKAFAGELGPFLAEKLGR